MTLGILLIGAYNGLVSSDMHPLRLIAPGRARRANMALRIVGNTLRLTLSAGLLLAAGLGVAGIGLSCDDWTEPRARPEPGSGRALCNATGLCAIAAIGAADVES